MDADDSFEEFSRVAMNGAAALSRAAEVLMRDAQNRNAQQTAETARAVEQLQRRAEAHAAAAAAHYVRAGEHNWVREAPAAEVAMAWKGVQQWAQLDPDRFAVHVARLNGQLQEQYGFTPRPGAASGNLDAEARRCEQQITAGRRSNVDPSSLAHATAAADAAPQVALTGPKTEAGDARACADYLIGYDPNEISGAARDGTSQRSYTQAGTSLDPTRERQRGRGH